VADDRTPSAVTGESHDLDGVTSAAATAPPDTATAPPDTATAPPDTATAPPPAAGGAEEPPAAETGSDERTGLPPGALVPTLVVAGVVGVLAAVGLAGQTWAVVVGGAGLAALGTVLTVIDLRTHRLPDRLVGPGVGGLLALLTVAAVVTGDGGALGRAVLAALASTFGYLLLGLARAGGLGLGDVKLAGLLGLWLGWFGWSAVLAGPVAAFLLGGVFAAVLLVTGRAGRQSDFAFGPWMLVGAVLATAGHLTDTLPV
jgi:leader peptidase (prepilin peptidase) / N-methyltransferase